MVILYDFSNFFLNILKNCSGFNGRTIKNSYEFKAKIKNLIVPADHTIISLDIISLLTNVPYELVLKSIDKKWNNIKKHTTLPKKYSIEGLIFIMDSCFLSYNEKYYKQIKGTLMGCPISDVFSA